MDEINTIIDELNKEPDFINSIKKQLGSWKSSPFDWAFEYIYGIDNDYRLVKTSKVSCFLNGDGLARVINADGLAPFNSKDYKEKLYNNNTKDLAAFKSRGLCWDYFT
jgi:type I restriction enzyme M protein